MTPPDKIYTSRHYKQPIDYGFFKTENTEPYTVEYIHKDALIEWAKDNLLECEVSNDETDYGRIDVYKKLIEKLNSM